MKGKQVIKPSSPASLLLFLERLLFFTLPRMAACFLHAGMLANWQTWMVLGILVLPFVGGYL
jgi:hypothetical protein